MEFKHWTESNEISILSKIHPQCEAGAHIDVEDYVPEQAPKLQISNCEIYREMPTEKHDIMGATLAETKPNLMKIRQGQRQFQRPIKDLCSSHSMLPERGSGILYLAPESVEMKSPMTLFPGKSVL